MIFILLSIRIFLLSKHSFEKQETFVIYYNPESYIDIFTENINEKRLSIGHIVYYQNNGKLVRFEYHIYNYDI